MGTLLILRSSSTFLMFPVAPGAPNNGWPDSGFPDALLRRISPTVRCKFLEEEFVLFHDVCFAVVSACALRARNDPIPFADLSFAHTTRFFLFASFAFCSLPRPVTSNSAPKVCRRLDREKYHEEVPDFCRYLEFDVEPAHIQGRCA